jgi:hypothetical protein
MENYNYVLVHVEDVGFRIFRIDANKISLDHPSIILIVEESELAIAQKAIKRMNLLK